ncbi:MAG: ankyrin repeat domain-containing protein, partial [Planctomycetes bacterium]|nr:ankyrin repeat domain-containing protein [Planctomycetota bacterium]
DNGAHINYSNPMKAPPLEFALHYGHDEVASMLIERGAHLNYYEPITPLLSACQHRCVLAFRAMVASEPDVAINQMDHPDSFGDVPLHWAARTGCKEIVQTLIDIGANVNARNANGGTPLKSAHYGKFSDVATLLESRGGQL